MMQFIVPMSISAETVIPSDDRKLLQMIDVKSFGAAGDGVTDDTLAFRSAINYISISGSTLYIPSGEYMINAVSKELPYHNDNGGIVIEGNNITLLLDKDAELKAIPNDSPGYAIINIKNSKNVVIDGGSVTGDRSAHEGDEGEFGYGIQIRNSKKIRIKNITISDCWGDGVFLGRTDANTVNEDIIIEKVLIKNNRRQGISVLSAVGLSITESVIEDTNGTAPSAGIDIEPNNIDRLENVLITKNIIRNNEGFGITIGGRTSIQKVNVLNNIIEGSPRGINVHTHPKFNAYVTESKIVDNIIILPKEYKQSIIGIGIYRFLNSTVTNNSILKEDNHPHTSGREYGFYVSNNISANVISGNSIKNTFWGIYEERGVKGNQVIDTNANTFSFNKIITNQ